ATAFLPNPPETASRAPNSSPPAIRTNSPTRVRSRFASMLLPDSELPDSFREHSQVVHLIVLRGVGNPVQKLADARMPAVLYFSGRPYGFDVPAVDQNDPVGDQECAGEFVR